MAEPSPWRWRKDRKSDAHHLIEAPARRPSRQEALRDALAADANVTAHLDASMLAKLFEPMAYQGVSQTLIDRLLASLDENSSDVLPA